MKTTRLTVSLVGLAIVASSAYASAPATSDQLMDLVKQVDKQQALPGDVLTYTMRFTNLSNKPLTDIIISDLVPHHTSYISATCIEPLPLGVETCSVYTNNANAPTAVRWEYSEPLGPGLTGTVELKVRVNGGTI